MRYPSPAGELARRRRYVVSVDHPGWRSGEQKADSGFICFVFGTLQSSLLLKHYLLLFIMIFYYSLLFTVILSFIIV